MALTVGELLAVLDVDDSAMRSGLATAEGAAQRSGQAIGDNVVRGADGRLRDLRGRFVAAGQDAGRGLADTVADSAGEGAAAAGGSIASRLGDSLKAGLAGAGIAAGAVLVAGFGQALEQGQITGRLGAQLGATPAEAEKYGKLAGKLYSNAVTEDFQSAADAISATMRAGIAPPDATEAQLEQLATGVSDLASTFELDLGQTANAIGQILKNGLAKNGTEALDTLTAGLQKMGPRADDIADTFNEYSTIFRQMGISATDATGLLSQGLQAGARDTDVVADALKEFVLITQGGGKEVDAAFAKIGLSGKEMQEAFTKGGPEAKAALDKVFDGLRGVGSESERQALAVALFGTKAEDTQKALYSLDPSTAVDALGQVGGKATEMGNSLRDNAGAQVEAFKRQAMQGLVDFLGGTVIPALMGFAGFLTEHQEELKLFAAVIAAVVVPALALLGAKALWAGLQMAQAWVVGLGPIGWIGLAIGALVVLVIAYWDDIKKYTLMAWDWIVGRIEWAKDAALAAVLLLGAIPGMVSDFFGDATDYAIAKLVALIVWVKGLPGRVIGAISALNSLLANAASQHFQRFKDAAVSKALSLISWVRGFPGRIVSAIGSLAMLLYTKGQDVVRGLLSGVKSKGAWLKSQLISFAKGMIPGPIAKALGINSPSKVMRDRIGRWIPAGIVEGIKGGAGAVVRTMQSLVPAPSLPSLAPAGAGAAMGGYGSPFAAQSTGGALVQIEHWHAAENGTPESNARELEWLAKARG
ncbi:phage tail tape measure protein [Streptomyces olivaceus]|uniref:phage tail tape measure protein n=1 Tax=Streptomyces olivaceus TaxID=47716 RepID=UPI001CCF35CB|nr:phage tail tape measure protein [Streptomyces olivaceus]MBZ6258124.1 phage tail tape measure protein [Streptomyces olivaceus]